MILYRLRDLRDDNDLTQQNIADILNVDRRTYSAYENGVNMIPFPYIIALSKFYNTSTDYIFGLTDDPKPYPKK